MIGRKNRFHGYNSLRNVYRDGKRVRGQMATLQYASRNPSKPYRAAVVVSRKTHKSAVVRNRIRRRIYEVVRNNDEKIKPGTDLVFTVYSDQVAELEPNKLQTIILDLLQKAE